MSEYEKGEGAAYALVSPTGRLVFRSGGPQRMLADATIAGAPPHEFTIISPSSGGHGLHGVISSIDRPIAPPNPVAAAIVTALGGPERDMWLGILGICGCKLGNPTRLAERCDLVAAQQRLIQAIHSRARRLASV